MNTIGGRIRHYRDKFGLSAAELADRVGVSQSYISHFENNRRTPPLKTLERIAKVFDVSVSDIDLAHVVRDIGDDDIKVKRNPPYLRREEGSIIIEVKNISCGISVKAKPREREKIDKNEFDLSHMLGRGFELAVEKAIYDILQNNEDDLLDIVAENLQKYNERWIKQIQYTNDLITDLQVLKDSKDDYDKED